MRVGEFLVGLCRTSSLHRALTTPLSSSPVSFGNNTCCYRLGRAMSISPLIRAPSSLDRAFAEPISSRHGACVLGRALCPRSCPKRLDTFTHGTFISQDSDENKRDQQNTSTSYMTVWCIWHLLATAGVPVLEVSAHFSHDIVGSCMCGYEYVRSCCMCDKCERRDVIMNDHMTFEKQFLLHCCTLHVITVTN